MMMNLPCLRRSCPNFLRPIYHTLSASQAPRRGRAPRKKPMPTTALVFMFDCYWPAFTCRGTDLLSGRYTTMAYCWSFCRCSPFRTPSFTGFCSRTLSSLRCLPSVTRQSSGVCYLYIFVSYAAIGACASTGRLISFNSFCGSYVVPVFRIV